MTVKKIAVKRKRGFKKLILASLFLSFLILYLLAALLWFFCGYEKTLSFYLSLLKANQVSLNGLNETLISNFLSSDIFKNASTYLDDAHFNYQTDTFTQISSKTLKEGISTFLNEDFTSDMLEKGSSFFHSAYIFILKSGWIFILSLKIFLIKVFLLIAAIPLFILLGTVGLIDGLSQREIRRAELGRESSYLFHMLNKWIARIIGVGLCIWVCIPVTLNPQWFFVPLGLLFSIMLSLSASRFKKYL